jgi:hypothetical protein
VSSQVITPILTGIFGLAGALGGILLTSHFSQRADERRINSEDKRRWLGELAAGMSTQLISP